MTFRDTPSSYSVSEIEKIAILDTLSSNIVSEIEKIAILDTPES